MAEAVCECGHRAKAHGSYEGKGPVVCLIAGCRCRELRIKTT